MTAKDEPRASEAVETTVYDPNDWSAAVGFVKGFVAGVGHHRYETTGFTSFPSEMHEAWEAGCEKLRSVRRIIDHYLGGTDAG